MPTNTPPPYFPQNSLSPPDPKSRLKGRLLLFGCALMSVLLLAGFIVGTIYLFKRVFF